MMLATQDSLISAPWLSGKRWKLAETDERNVMAMHQQLGLPEVLCRLLVQRGVSIDGAEDYLNPGLKQFLPDPFHLKDMEAAVNRIIQAIHSHETIGIFGDYDVDGATSSALLAHYFRWINIPYAVHIPDRQKEGYGPNMFGFLRLKEQKAKLIITVDTGTLAHHVLAEAAQNRLETIVIDHHQGEPTLPEAVAVVNPNRFDETSQEGHLAAVGVTFLLLVALHKRLKASGYFTPGNQRAEPDLRWLLDIVALGTVCDVVPLRGVNRAFVSQGLKVLRQRQNIGLAALMDVAGLDEPPTPYHLGFLLGPRINAGGRVGLSDLGVRLLTATHREEALELAKQLDAYNKERKAIESHVLEEATTQAERQQNHPFILAAGEGWHEGVIGIVAGRLKEQFNRPAAVITWKSDGTGKASARSVSGVDLGQAVIAARQQGLLMAGGGHAMAAGFSLKREALDSFQDFLFTQLGPAIRDYQENHLNEVEGSLPCTAMTIELAELLEKAGPYGAGNPTPRLLLPSVRILSADVMGTNHLRLMVADALSIGTGVGPRLKVVAFGIVDTPMGQALLNHRGKHFQLIGKLKKESWQGRESATFMLEDAQYL